ncbi:methyltransferase type 12 [Candidatus Vecturithrix granuli]|uniref:Methyltransferase type 12 n=1 Tax=Vecturithrix granuli TaxID=1499967 RepID=A0A081C2M2_VECG1|nr:methyltransferase type 12 [Candidatus Vecturithrix granuli]
MMSKVSSISKAFLCPVCNSTNFENFLELVQTPVFCNVLWKTADEALHVPKGDIRLAFCRTCGHVFNTAFDPGLIEYSTEYENSLHFSPRFQAYAASLAKQLINAYDLHQKTIIEIGCGKGDFLRLLCESGNNCGIGFDRSYEPERNETPDRACITFVRDFYSKQYAHYKADFICCRHVLEHIQEPRRFLDEIRQTLGDQSDAVLYFEVPNVMFTLKDLGIWDLIYEHCGYFSRSSLASLFSDCGFQTKHVQEAFADQFLGIEAAIASEEGSQIYRDLKDDVENMHAYVTKFGKNYRMKVTSWKHELAELSQAEKKVIVWGAGSKGVTFLNALHVQEQIVYIVDINPHKHGKYVGGTGQKIVAPDFLREYRPDTILVMNAIYLQEIQAMMHTMNLHCEFMLV